MDRIKPSWIELNRSRSNKTKYTKWTEQTKVFPIDRMDQSFMLMWLKSNITTINVAFQLLNIIKIYRYRFVRLM